MYRAVGLPRDDALRLELRSFYDLSRTEGLGGGSASFAERREVHFKGR
jgi:hypothetical protein